MITLFKLIAKANEKNLRTNLCLFESQLSQAVLDQENKMTMTMMHCFSNKKVCYNDSAAWQFSTLSLVTSIHKVIVINIIKTIISFSIHAYIKCFTLLSSSISM